MPALHCVLNPALVAAEETLQRTVNLHNAKYARLFKLWLLSNYDTEKTVAACIKRNRCFNFSLHYVHKSRLDGKFLYVSLSMLYYVCFMYETIERILNKSGVVAAIKP
jgi:hypothetical protein